MQSMGCRQLAQTQQYQIHACYDLGMSQRQIGRELSLHSSTISRELRRSTTSDGYGPEQAQALSDHRRSVAWKCTKRLPSMIAAVVIRLREEWSPEQISGFMPPLAGEGVSHQWIFALIWDDKAQGSNLWRHLRQPKWRNKHRVQAKSAGLDKIPNRVGIEHRPAEDDARLVIGHW